MKYTLASLSVLVWSAVASAQPATGDYQRAVDTALREYQAGHYEEARGLFQHAHELEPSARTLRGLGMVEYELRHYVRANELLEAALTSESKPLTEQQRTAVRDLLERTTHLIARYELVVAPARAVATVEVDGERVDAGKPFKLAVGEHAVRVSADGYQPSELHLDAKGGERRTLRVLLQSLESSQAPAPVARTRPHRSLGIVLTAVGGAALVAGGVVGGLALAQASDAPTVDGTRADGARSLALGADIAIAVGAASLVSGVVLWLWRRPEREHQVAARVEGVFPHLKLRF